MKKFLLLVFVVLLAFVVVNRNRVFVRDPLAHVVRNGVAEDGAQVYINYRNDVLIENDREPMYVELIEAGRPIGGPKRMHCIHWMACLLPSDPPDLVEENPGSHIESMDAKAVRFIDTGARATVVTLR